MIYCFLEIIIVFKLQVLGRLAQLVEHLVYTEGVKGSSPLLPTKQTKWGCSSVG